MKANVIRYKTKPDHADENERLIREVFRELKAKAPEGVRYLALRVSDGTFIHFVTVDTPDGKSPVPGLTAFQAFQKGIGDRTIEPPLSGEVTIVGNYGMIDD